MTKDPIVEELHRQRAEEMERLEFDFDAFYRELKEQERLSSETVLSPPERSAPSPARRTRAGRR
jgi:hypothetical protein